MSAEIPQTLTPEAREERRRVILLLEQWSRPKFIKDRFGDIGDYEFSVIGKIVFELKRDVLAGAEAEDLEA